MQTDMDIIVEYTAAYCRKYPDQLKNSWLTPTADGGVRGRFILPYSERVANGKRMGTLRDDEHGLIYTFKQDVMFNRHVSEGFAPPPNKIELTWNIESGRVEKQAWHEKKTTDKAGMVNGLKRIPCTITEWNELPAISKSQTEAPGAKARTGHTSAKARAAGQKKAKVTHTGDRSKIRKEVNRLTALSGMTKGAACQQVAEQARKGKVWTHKLTTAYNVPELTVYDVRRIADSDR